MAMESKMTEILMEIDREWVELADIVSQDHARTVESRARLAQMNNLVERLPAEFRHELDDLLASHQREVENYAIPLAYALGLTRAGLEPIDADIERARRFVGLDRVERVART
jgi:hypothetical protein